MTPHRFDNGVSTDVSSTGYVAFTSSSLLVKKDTDGFSDVYGRKFPAPATS